MLKRIAFATITAAALAAPPSLAVAQMRLNTLAANGVNLYGAQVNGVEPRGRAVYCVDARPNRQSNTVLTIDLPRTALPAEARRAGAAERLGPSHARLTSGASGPNRQEDLVVAVNTNRMSSNARCLAPAIVPALPTLNAFAPQVDAQLARAMASVNVEDTQFNLTLPDRRVNRSQVGLLTGSIFRQFD